MAVTLTPGNSSMITVRSPLERHAIWQRSKPWGLRIRSVPPLTNVIPAKAGIQGGPANPKIWGHHTD